MNNRLEGFFLAFRNYL